MDEVLAYWNLREDVFSIRFKKTGRVEKRLRHCYLHNAGFKVWAGGIKKVRETRQKTVCAFVTGLLSERPMAPVGHPEGRRVIFDPYRFTQFVYADTLEPALPAKRVVLSTVLVPPGVLKPLVLALPD